MSDVFCYKCGQKLKPKEERSGYMNLIQLVVAVALKDEGKKTEEDYSICEDCIRKGYREELKKLEED